MVKKKRRRKLLPRAVMLALQTPAGQAAWAKRNQEWLTNLYDADAERLEIQMNELIYQLNSK